MHITSEPILIAEFLSKAPDAGSGTVASFIGYVRNLNEGKRVARLFYECYEQMADREISRLIDQIKEETQVHEIRIIHRVGWLEIGEAAVAVWVCAPHRDEAFAACRAVIDEIKKRVPIWKKEVYQDGSSEWVLCGQHTEEVA